MRAVVSGLAVLALVCGCMKERELDPGSPLVQGGPSLGTSGSEPIDSAPPISGGTLLIAAEGTRAFVSDPDRHRVLLVDLQSKRVDAEIDLPKGTHPARAVEDGDGFVHVLLRGAGTVLTLSEDGENRGEREVCAAPRGIGYDATRNELVIACVGGELSRFDPAPGGARSSKTMLEPDLRDVVVLGDKTFVSVFRRPKLLVLDASGEILKEVEPPGVAINGDMKLPTVAWRMVEWPGRGVVVSHQRASTRSIEIGADAPPNAYGQSGSDPLVEPVLTVIDEDGGVVESITSAFPGVLPVDASVSETDQIAVTMAGSALVVLENGLSGVSIPAEPLAAQYAGSDLVVQTRQPSTLQIVDESGSISVIELDGDDVSDVGHAIFHGTGGSATPLACASCHPEGRDDAHTWSFSPLGPRRTQTLLGDVTNTAPFHWDGDQKSMTVLMDEVFTRRMGNAKLSPYDVDGFSKWLSGLRDLPASPAGKSSPGREAFEKAGCDTCHAGDRLTTGGNADVGTGATFQIPSLVGLRYRTPLLHDGCASSIEERFGPCGGDDHGDTDKLDDGEMGDLIEYLRSL
jgi:hypothetical protein